MEMMERVLAWEEEQRQEEWAQLEMEEEAGKKSQSSARWETISKMSEERRAKEAQSPTEETKGNTMEEGSHWHQQWQEQWREGKWN